MGFAKRLMEEEQGRPFELSSEAICAECFIDNGLKNFVVEHAEEVACSVCGKTEDHAIAAPANAVLEFFFERLALHYEDANTSAPWDSGEGGWQVTTYRMYDLVYNNLEEIGPSDTLDWLFSKIDTVWISRAAGRLPG